MQKRKKHKRTKKPSSRLSFFQSQTFIIMLLIIGIILITGSLFLKAHEENKLSFTQSLPEIVSTSAKPAKIEIPSLHINLPVGQTIIENGKWSIYKDGASHLSSSANPDSNGNIIMYAHNTKKRFGNLTNIKKNEKIIITNTNGQKKEYRITNIQTVNPNQIALLLPTTTETLTLYTCTGFADSKRFVAQAIPIN